jgi:hypothetical protein
MTKLVKFSRPAPDRDEYLEEGETPTGPTSIAIALCPGTVVLPSENVRDGETICIVKVPGHPKGFKVLGSVEEVMLALNG